MTTSQNLKIFQLQKQNSLKEKQKKLSPLKNQKNPNLKGSQSKKKFNNYANRTKRIWKMSKVNIQHRSGEAKRNAKSVWKLIYKRSGYNLMRTLIKDKKLKLKARILNSRGFRSKRTMETVASQYTVRGNKRCLPDNLIELKHHLIIIIRKKDIILFILIIRNIKSSR